MGSGLPKVTQLSPGSDSSAQGFPLHVFSTSKGSMGKGTPEKGRCVSHPQEGSGGANTNRKGLHQGN